MGKLFLFVILCVGVGLIHPGLGGIFFVGGLMGMGAIALLKG
jgi:hypothetical protein